MQTSSFSVFYAALILFQNQYLDEAMAEIVGGADAEHYYWKQIFEETNLAGPLDISKPQKKKVWALHK